MRELPAGLRRGRDVDLRGRGGHVWLRRAGVGLLAGVSVAALTGAIGQQPGASATSARAATLTVREPDRLRLGLLFQATITVRAREAIETPRLRLSRGWFEEVQMTTVEPVPLQERPAPPNGNVEWEYPPLRPGEVLVIWLQHQVNPTAAGTRDRSVALLDGDREIAVVHRELTVLP